MRARRTSAALVFGQIGRTTAVGAVIGLVAAVSIAQVGQSLFFGIDGMEPAIMAAALAVVLTVALCAAAMPAQRAARTNPSDALRAE